MYPITIEEFKTFFAKDFDYGDEIDQVSDIDITKAMTEASMNFNEKLFESIEEKKLVFSYLTAYYLVVDINNANTQGASNNGGLVTYRQVRNVAESFKVPKLKYITLIYPYLIGTMGVVPGATLP